MRQFWTCRRTFVAVVGILAIGAVCVWCRDTSGIGTIGLIVGAIAGANAYQATRSNQ